MQGATTSGRTAYTIINSTYPDYSHWAALEMVLHEVAHVNGTGRNSKLRKMINAEFAECEISPHTVSGM